MIEFMFRRRRIHSRFNLFGFQLTNSKQELLPLVAQSTTSTPCHPTFAAAYCTVGCLQSKGQRWLTRSERQPPDIWQKQQQQKKREQGEKMEEQETKKHRTQPPTYHLTGRVVVAASLDVSTSTVSSEASTVTTTTLVSVCSPVTVTAGRSVVVKGTVSRIVMDRTLATQSSPVLLEETAGVSEEWAVKVTVLGSRVSVVTWSVIVTVVVRGAAAVEDVEQLSSGMVITDVVDAHSLLDVKERGVPVDDTVTVMVVLTGSSGEVLLTAASLFERL
ncbi:hypothetical protein N658DRAFT_127006 [Parathielavia hyrcaniae]|uniref:Uncharacterized protein n=1 Tax=Parathielavia hyrcaniae TaxID=113614 RepID=A0AAN6Q9Z6_9PEZI|nr:hypothetical protein N658DRAFT_127006 [Parathielavia hyrcaniae]